MDTYWPWIVDNLYTWKDFIISSDFLENYSMHFIYSFFLLILLVFNPFRPKSKIDLFLKTYKDCFTHEISLKKNFTRKTKFNNFCVSLIDISLLVGFLLSLTDIPNSQALDYMVGGESAAAQIFANEGMGPESSSGYFGWVKKAGILVYLMLQEHKINLYFKTAIVLLGFRILLRSWRGTFQSDYQVMLRQIQSDKHVFVDKFFELVGDQFAGSLEKYILQKNKIKSKASEKLKEKNLRLEKELKKTKEDIGAQNGEAGIYREFAESIIDFQWCQACFDFNEFQAVKRPLAMMGQSNGESGLQEQNLRKMLKKLLNTGDIKSPQTSGSIRGKQNSDKRFLSQSNIITKTRVKKIGDDSDDFEKVEQSPYSNDKTTQNQGQSQDNESGENNTINSDKNEENMEKKIEQNGEKKRTQSEEKKKKRIGKERSGWDLLRRNLQEIRTNKADCQENCLILFLLKCDQIGKHMHAQLGQL